MSPTLPKTPSFLKHVDEGHMGRVAFHLLAEVEGAEPDPFGSGVVIAPGLGLTARHVVEDYERKFDPRQRERGGPALFATTAFQVVPSAGRRVGLAYLVANFWLSAASDLALVQLVPQSPPPADFEPIFPVLELRMPPVGSRVCAFGYMNCSVTVSGERVHISRDPATSVGEVVDLHPGGRDAQLSWPCFQTNARYDGGMSGGPVFDDAGHLVGLVCKNMPPFEPGDEHVSYVTSLWPVMGAVVPTAEGPTSLLDLAKRGAIQALGAERVGIIRAADGGVGEVTFRS